MEGFGPAQHPNPLIYNKLWRNRVFFQYLAMFAHYTSFSHVLQDFPLGWAQLGLDGKTFIDAHQIFPSKTFHIS